MIEELHYTSAQRGLSPGVSGFCTVARTASLPDALQSRLESLSAHQLDARNGQVNHACTRLSLQGRSWCILSRVCDAGTDYTGRSNLYAHHLALPVAEAPDCGPAWLMRQQGVLDTAWAGEPRVIQRGRALPDRPAPAGPCKTWQSVTGDAGWAGVLANFSAANPDGVAWLICRPGTDVLALFDEALRLLPPVRRWHIGFATLPHPDLERQYAWRACLAGTPLARRAASQPGALVIDCSKQLPAATGGALVEQARNGSPAGPAHRGVARRAAPAPARGKPAAKAAASPVKLELMPDSEPAPAWAGPQPPAGPIRPAQFLPKIDEPLVPTWAWAVGLLLLIGCGVGLFLVAQEPSAAPTKVANQETTPEKKVNPTPPIPAGVTGPRKRDSSKRPEIPKAAKHTADSSKTKRPASQPLKYMPIKYVPLWTLGDLKPRFGHDRVARIIRHNVEELLEVHPGSIRWGQFQVKCKPNKSEFHYSIKHTSAIEGAKAHAELTIRLTEQHQIEVGLVLPGVDNQLARDVLHSVLSNMRILTGNGTRRQWTLLRSIPETTWPNDKRRITPAPLLLSERLLEGAGWKADMRDFLRSRPVPDEAERRTTTFVWSEDGRLKFKLTLHGGKDDEGHQFADQVEAEASWDNRKMEDKDVASAPAQLVAFTRQHNNLQKRLDLWVRLEKLLVDQPQINRWRWLENLVKRPEKLALAEGDKPCREQARIVYDELKEPQGRNRNIKAAIKRRTAKIKPLLEELIHLRAMDLAARTQFTLVDCYGFELLKVRIQLEKGQK